MITRIDEFRRIEEGRRDDEAILDAAFGGHVGLNAEWACKAWSVGGGLYVADNEDGTYSVVRRVSDPETEENTDHDLFTGTAAEAILRAGGLSNRTNESTKPGRFFFKTEKPTGSYRSFYPSQHHVKTDARSKKTCGAIGDKPPHKIRLKIMKDERHTDDNPNCAWMWVTLKKESQTLQEAKDWLNQNHEAINKSFTLFSN